MNQVLTEHELKVAPAVNQQVKLLSALRSARLDDVMHTLQAVLGIADFRLGVENERMVSDEYYDTDDLAMYATHSVFRIRREGGTPKLVIKKLVGQDQGELRRTEDETDLSETDLRELKASVFASIVESKLKDLRNKKLTLKLKMTNDRRNYSMERGSERFRLSLDSFVYTNPADGRTSGQQFEIEIEALNDAASCKLGDIKHNLLEVLNGFTFSKGSKYERGIKLYYMDRAEWFQVLSKWSTGPGLNWISVIIGIVGIVLAFWFASKKP